MANVRLSFLEDFNKDKYMIYTAKDAVLDINYPTNCFTNTLGMKYVRILFCTYMITDQPVHIHEIFIINFFNTEKSTSVNNSSIQVNLETSVFNERVLPGTANATCTAMKADSFGEMDINHNVMITEEQYENSAGALHYGLGLWVDINYYKYIAIDNLYSMSLSSIPIHKNHFKSYYHTEYINDSNKKTDYNMSNIEMQINANQIGVGIYDSQKVLSDISFIKDKLSKIPDTYVQNSIYYSNTYIPQYSDIEETIPPYSIRGTFTEKIVSLDNINKSFRVLQDGVYCLQVHNGFYTTTGNTQLYINTYKNTDMINELSVKSYLEEGKINTTASNMAVLQLSKSDLIYMKLKWSNKDVIMSHDTHITIYPIRLY